MNHWLEIILVSYLILSVSNIVDKIFLSSVVTESIVYALWVSLLSVGLIALFAVLALVSTFFHDFLAPLGHLTLMTPWFVFVAAIDGILFTAAIYLLYTALQKGEASRVIPMMGGATPVIIYAITFWYEPLENGKLIAFIFLVIGTVVISLMPKHDGGPKHSGNVLAIAASFSFAVFFVVTHYLFNAQGFINGLVWPRLGSAFAVLFLLAFPHIRRLMKNSLKHLSGGTKTMWLGAQALGAVGFLGQQYVISIPGVRIALVSALQGVQYVFILLLAIALSRSRPHLLNETITPAIIVQKIIALALIAVGFYFIAV